jgi:hypothetical protein
VVTGQCSLLAVLCVRTGATGPYAAVDEVSGAQIDSLSQSTMHYSSFAACLSYASVTGIDHVALPTSQWPEHSFIAYFINEVSSWIFSSLFHLLVNHAPTLLSQLSTRIGISICQKGFLHTKSAYRSYTPLITTSVFGMLGSVKSKNFVPVSV